MFIIIHLPNFGSSANVTAAEVQKMSRLMLLVGAMRMGRYCIIIHVLFQNKVVLSSEDRKWRMLFMKN